EAHMLAFGMVAVEQDDLVDAQLRDLFQGKLGAIELLRRGEGDDEPAGPALRECPGYILEEGELSRLPVSHLHTRGEARPEAVEQDDPVAGAKAQDMARVLPFVAVQPDERAGPVRQGGMIPGQIAYVHKSLPSPFHADRKTGNQPPGRVFSNSQKYSSGWVF